MSLFRQALLGQRVIALTADVQPDIAATLAGLGASVRELPAADSDDEHAGEWARANLPVHGLVVAMAADPPDPARVKLSAAMEPGWSWIRALAAEALIPAEEGGKVVLLAPAPEPGPFALALRAATENLARTLSVEWARHGITVTAVTPGRGTSGSELANVIAYLLSSAGDYFSGCRVDLGAVSR
jgi:NAD(P)-dependent dehydrogenase (short-subunit alcohol dehydrogenase family)